MTRTIAVLVTCFNRREKTLACLRRLAGQVMPEGYRMEIYLVDDGCTDGTGRAVRSEFPKVRVIQGTGSLYWAGGMRLAWSEAAKTQPDYYLLLNDDTEIIPEALQTLLRIAGSPESRVIAVSAITAPDSTTVIYGAYKKHICGNLKSGDPKDWCDTFNANCALVTRKVYLEIGSLSSLYTHGMADHDYGFKASRKNINIIQSTQALGTCEPNSKKGTWQDNSLPRIKRLIMMQKPNSLPFAEWLIYCIRNHHLKGILYFIRPYVKVMFFR